MADDFTPDNVGTNGRLYLSYTGDTGFGSIAGNLEAAGDTDWFRVTLYAGHNYVIDERGKPTNAGTLTDPLLQLANSAGTVVTSDDDSGFGFESQITVHVNTTGTYYAIAGSFNNGFTGPYLVQATDLGTGAATDRFQMPSSSPSLASFGASSAAGGWASEDQYPRTAADVNGDGQADIIGFGAAGTYVSLNLGNNQFSAPTLALAGFGSGATGGGFTSQNTYPRVLGDVNGDNRADVVAFASNGVYVAEGQANGTFGAPIFALVNMFGNDPAAGGWTSQDQYPRLLGDVNGDGHADIVAFASNGVYVAEGQANGTFAAPILADANMFGNSATAGGWTSQDQYPRLIADVNGDGRADIVAFASNGVYVAEGQTNGTFGAAVLALSGAFDANDGFTNQNATPRLVADINGDGRADIVGFGFNDVQYALGQGNGTFGPITTDSVAAFTQAQGFTSNDLYPRVLADVTGDRRADIVGFGSAGVFTSPSHDFTTV